MDRSSSRLVVLVGSAGSLDALRALLTGVPRQLDVPFLVVRHGQNEQLPAALAPHTRRHVEVVRNGVHPAPGTVHLAPGGHGIHFDDEGAMRTVPAPIRPAPHAGDVTLTAAADAFGPGLVAVVLSGRLDDACAGVVDVHAAGGRVIAQDPATAAADGMPRAAIETGRVDRVLHPAAIGSALLEPVRSG